MAASIAATATVTAARAAIKPRMATERPAIRSLAVRALSTKAAVSARGSFGRPTCHSVRRQEARAAQHDLPPFDPDPLAAARDADIAEEPKAGRLSGAELSVQVRSGT